MNENQRDLSNIIYCLKCGAEMRKDSRYCMKCGNLNYSHPDNESMKQYAWQNIAQGTYISGVDLEGSGKPIYNMLKTKVNKSCLFTNLILHFLVPVVITIMMILSNTFNSKILLLYLVFGILFILNYSMQLVYIKAGKEWWSYLIPIYGQFVFFEIAMNNGLLFFLNLIPVVGTIVNFIAYYKLGVKFYKNGWLTAFFPFIIIPMIAFDKNAELSIAANDMSLSDLSSNTGKTNMEKEYSRKKIAIILIVLGVILIALYFAWPILEFLYSKIIELIGNIQK